MPVLLHGLTKKVDPRRLSPSLLAVADLIEPELAEIFIAVVTDTRTRINLEDLAEAIIAGDLESTEVAAQLGFLESSLNEKLPEPLRRAFLRAADAVADVLEEDFNIAVRFDVSNPNAVEYARDQVGVNVREIARETVTAIRDIVARSVGAEVGQAEPVVREIRDVIGLRTEQIDQVNRYRDDLVAGGADRLAAELKATKEANRLLGERALLIARTEVMDALNAGAMASWRQAIDKGLVNPSEVTVEWIATPDEKTCPICGELDGERVNVGQPWHSAELGESIDRPPAHPNCRCVSAMIPKTVEELQADDAARAPRAASHRPVTKYSPDQPRVPAGSADGGQWTDGGGWTARHKAHRPVTRGYPEFNPDQPRDEGGQWTGGSGSVGGAEPEPGNGWAAKQEDVALSLRPLRATVDEGLQAALDRGVPADQVQSYRVATNRALGSMSRYALQSLALTVQEIDYRGNVDGVTAEFMAMGGARRNGEVVYAFWSGTSGKLVLDGTADLTGRDAGVGATWEIYAHEFTHAIDTSGPSGTMSDRYSTTQEWQEAWTDEIYAHGTGAAPLSEYARNSMSEGFAEYGRLVLKSPRAAQEKFPRSWAYWKLHQLV